MLTETLTHQSSSGPRLSAIPEVPVTILIVDDDPDILLLLECVLSRPGTSILRADDGPAALAAAHEHTPDIILLDVNMPGISGFEVCRYLRDDSRTRHIPIMMLTVRGEAYDQIRGLKLGADDYVNKPFDVPTLRARVQALLRCASENRELNPLTRLPGSPAIEREVHRRLNSRDEFAFAYIDIRNFKSFNDAYGFYCGNAVILATACLLRAAAKYPDGGSGFAGHIGGDDFVLIRDVPIDVSVLKDSFLRMAQRYYDAEELRKRSAHPALGRPISLTVAQIPCPAGRYLNLSEIASAASRVKEWSKGPARPSL